MDRGLKEAVVMADNPEDDQNKVEGDPERGDRILKRMLRTKPKPHKAYVGDRQSKRSDQVKRSDAGLGESDTGRKNDG